MPEDILNYNDNWNTVSGLMEVFHAYNQQQQDEGKPWSKWPDWELCLTDMKHELHFDDEGFRIIACTEKTLVGRDATNL